MTTEHTPQPADVARTAPNSPPVDPEPTPTPIGRLSEQERAEIERIIRLPNDGRIDVVTSSAQSRLGNPITFALQDETQLYDDAHDCWEDHLGEGHGHREPTGDSQ